MEVIYRDQSIPHISFTTSKEIGNLKGVEHSHPPFIGNPDLM